MSPQVGDRARFKVDSSGIHGKYPGGFEFVVDRVLHVKDYRVVSFKSNKAPYDEWVWTDDRFEVIE